MPLKSCPDLGSCDSGDKKFLQIYKTTEQIWDSGPFKNLGPWEIFQFLESQFWQAKFNF